MTDKEKLLNENFRELSEHRLVPRNQDASQREQELFTRMSWRAANAATSSVQELDFLKEKNEQLKAMGLGESFATSDEEGLAYCVQLMDSMCQGGVFGGFDMPDVDVMASQLDAIFKYVVRLRIEIAYGQLDPWTRRIPPATPREQFPEQTEEEEMAVPDQAKVCEEVRDYLSTWLDYVVKRTIERSK